MNKYPCPVCKTPNVLSGEGSYEICHTCGWEDDFLQRDDPDFKPGANKMSLNEARKAYKEGKPVK